MWNRFRFVWTGGVFVWSDEHFVRNDLLFVWNQKRFVWNDELFEWNGEHFVLKDPWFAWKEPHFFWNYAYLICSILKTRFLFQMSGKWKEGDQGKEAKKCRVSYYPISIVAAKNLQGWVLRQLEVPGRSRAGRSWYCIRPNTISGRTSGTRSSRTKPKLLRR